MDIHKHRECRRLFVVAGCVAFSVVALLLWGRLKMVAGVPRTALAEPESTQKAAAARPAPAVPVEPPVSGRD